MAFNKYMHPSNHYKNKKPSFCQLAEKYDFFREVAQRDSEGRVSLDFKIPSHLAVLAKALLLEDFGLSVELPPDRLVPTVPLRVNYILWLEDILKSFHHSNRAVTVLDIGVGASCIYPLLGAVKYSWNFYGTEIDARNFAFAKDNVKKNGLERQIQLIHISENASSLEAVFVNNPDPPSFYLDMVMANPPFFCDSSEAVGGTANRSVTRPPAKTISSAARHESQTPGGEVYFCMRLARDSVKYATRVGVFTVMLGKKSSVAPMRRILRKLNIPKVSVYELCQGRVMRWGLAWTFLPAVEFPLSEFRRLKKLERPPLTYTVPPTVSCIPVLTVDSLLDWLRDEFKALHVRVLDQKNRFSVGGYRLSITAFVNTWTHCRRKRREAQRLARSPAGVSDSPISDTSHASTTNNNSQLGDSNGVLQSPASSLKRKLTLSETEQSRDSAMSDGQQQVGISADDEVKRTRLCDPDEVCAESDAWIDFNQALVSIPPGVETAGANVEPIIHADVSVEAQINEAGERSSDDDSEEEETTVGEELQSADKADGVDVDMKTTDGPLVIKIRCLGGSCREAANQILCYLKGRLR